MEGVVLREQDDGNCLTTLDTRSVAKRRSLTSNDRCRPFPSAALPVVSSTACKKVWWCNRSNWRWGTCDAGMVVEGDGRQIGRYRWSG